MIQRFPPSQHFGQCRFPGCKELADCDCSDCRLNYCREHSFSVVHRDGAFKGTVCTTCKNRRLSLYTGILPSHFKPRGAQSLTERTS